MPITAPSRPIRRAAVITIGCRLNQAESDMLRGRLRHAGWLLADNPAESEVCYINTCTVTAAADRSSLQMIHRVCRLEPKPRVIVLGCLAERVPEKLRSLPGVDEVWSQQQKRNELAGFHPFPARSRALLKVQDGCDRRCSYCVVAGLRGQPLSVESQEILSRLDQLLDEGFCEIVLTGLNLGLYRDSFGTNLAGLLRIICNHLNRRKSPARIRLGSLEPDTVTEDLIQACAEPRIAPHFHLALQSGDDHVLAAAGRRYRREQVRKLVKSLYAVRPDANLGLDVIVGLPQEDDTAFARTVEFLQELTPGYLHVFAFSPRPGTPAAQRNDIAPAGEKKERVHLLRQMSTEFRKAYQARFLGKVRSAVVESRTSALSDNYLKLSLVGFCAERKSLVEVLLCEEQGRLTGRQAKPDTSHKEVA